MTWTELRDLQRRLAIEDFHLIEIVPHGFNIVHPRAEREARIQLNLCAFHLVLRDPEWRPPHGVYIMHGCSSKPTDYVRVPV